MKTASSCVWRWRSSSPAPSTPPALRNNRAKPSRATSKACCGCCRPIPSPNIPSTRPTASSPIRRPPARCRSTTSRASTTRRCSTPPMSPKTFKNAGANRPLTFVFNGGPGAASAFLHLGLVGPRILDLGARRHPRGTARQSRHLARLHRSGADRSDRHRLEPHGQSRRRQALLEHRQRRQCDGEGDRALRQQEQPRRLAEISAGRKLWRLPRRQDGARAAAGPGHRRLRHRHGVAAARRAG